MVESGYNHLLNQFNLIIFKWGSKICCFQAEPLGADNRPLGPRRYVRSGLIGFMGPVSGVLPTLFQLVAIHNHS